MLCHRRDAQRQSQRCVRASGKKWRTVTSSLSLCVAVCLTSRLHADHSNHAAAARAPSCTAQEREKQTRNPVGFGQVVAPEGRSAPDLHSAGRYSGAGADIDDDHAESSTNEGVCLIPLSRLLRLLVLLFSVVTAPGGFHLPKAMMKVWAVPAQLYCNGTSHPCGFQLAHTVLPLSLE